MAVQIARHLNQDIAAMMEWELAMFFWTFDRMTELLRLEARAGEAPGTE